MTVPAVLRLSDSSHPCCCERLLAIIFTIGAYPLDWSPYDSLHGAIDSVWQRLEYKGWVRVKYKGGQYKLFLTEAARAWKQTGEPWDIDWIDRRKEVARHDISEKEKKRA